MVLRDMFGHIDMRPLHFEVSGVLDPSSPDPLEISPTPLHLPVSSSLDTMKKNFSNGSNLSSPHCNIAPSGNLVGKNRLDFLGMTERNRWELM